MGLSIFLLLCVLGEFSQSRERAGLRMDPSTPMRRPHPTPHLSSGPQPGGEEERGFLRASIYLQLSGAQPGSHTEDFQWHR
ncbi:KLK12 isoform 4, partial [Pan troglodytes]